MRKAGTAHRLTGAHIVILMEFDGSLYSYLSDNYFDSVLNGIHVKKHFSPDDFDTIADRNGGEDSQESPTPPSTSSTFTSTSAAVIQRPSPNFYSHKSKITSFKGRQRPYPLAANFWGIK